MRQTWIITAAVLLLVTALGCSTAPAPAKTSPTPAKAAEPPKPAESAKPAPTAPPSAQAAKTAAPAPKAAEPAKAVAPRVIAIGTSGVSGTYYPVGGAIAKLVSDKVPGMTATAKATGGSTENVRLVSGKELWTAMTSALALTSGYAGTTPFETKQNIRVAFNTMPIFGYAFSLNANLKQATDLRNKRIAVGDPGSGTRDGVRAILGAYGIQPADFKELFLGKSNATDALKDGAADAVFEFGGARVGFVADLALVRKVYFIQFPAADNKKLEAAGIPYRLTTIPADWFKTPEPFQSPFSVGAMIVHPDANEEDVYLFTKVVFDNLEPVRKSHPGAAGMALEMAVADQGVPYHPGAIRYFKEKGVWQR